MGPERESDFGKAVRTFPRREFVEMVRGLDWLGKPLQSTKVVFKYVRLWFRINLFKPEGRS
ncbi:MAG: hypothetical protein ACLPOO_16720 [Terriglobales bacterium]